MTPLLNLLALADQYDATSPGPGSAHARIAGEIRWAVERLTWRPIETAPKDGTPIIIARPTWFLPEEGWHVVRWDDDCWTVHDGKSDHTLRGPTPTHWMPVPDAPQHGEGGS